LKLHSARTAIDNVAAQTSKKQILLELFKDRRKDPIAAHDLHVARNQLRRTLGPSDKTSLTYIASTLRKAGFDVRYEDRYADPAMPEPYSSQLKGALEFRDLARTEQSLLRIDTIYREYQRAADRAGMNWVRAIVKKGKLRARSLASNPRVQEEKRQEKREIANWFQVWLETPELFADWLTLRKSSEEFRKLFGMKLEPHSDRIIPD
jgi:hypothetical protein